MESVIVALITGGLSLVGVIISNLAATRKIEDRLPPISLKAMRRSKK